MKNKILLIIGASLLLFLEGVCIAAFNYQLGFDNGRDTITEAAKVQIVLSYCLHGKSAKIDNHDFAVVCFDRNFIK